MWRTLRSVVLTAPAVSREYKDSQYVNYFVVPFFGLTSVADSDLELKGTGVLFCFAQPASVSSFRDFFFYPT